jgi:hypothetical protein
MGPQDSVMLSEKQQYQILDALNEPLEPLARSPLAQDIRIRYSGLDLFSCYTIETLQPLLTALPQVRVDMLIDILATLDRIQLTTTTNAIGNKARLIKADVLEWSDRPEQGQSDLGSLRGDALKRIRVMLGLRSIDALLAEFGRGGSCGGMNGRLYRS